MYQQTSLTSQEEDLKPIGLLTSLLLFGIPMLIAIWSNWWLWPALRNVGFSDYGSYSFSVSLVTGGLFFAAMVGYKWEGNPWAWDSFCKRMRLSNLSAKGWIITVIAALIFGILSLFINFIAGWFYEITNFPLPELYGEEPILWMTVVTLFLNIFGEELWWRSYILPRQEVAFGKFTWLLHGCLWAFFHMFKWYAVPFMLITCQIIPYVAQKLKNTWPGILSHFLVNGVGILLSVLAIL